MGSPRSGVDDRATGDRTWSHGGRQAGWRKLKPSVEMEPRDLTISDLLCAVVGLLTVGVSFFVYYTHTSDQGFGTARRVSGAWVGLKAPIGEISVVLAGASSLLFLVVGVIMAHSHSVALRTVVLIGFVTSAVTAAIAYFVHPPFRFGDIDTQFANAVQHGNGYGYWAAAALILTGVIASFVRLLNARHERAVKQQAARDELAAAGGGPVEPVSPGGRHARGRHSG